MDSRSTALLPIFTGWVSCAVVLFFIATAHATPSEAARWFQKGKTAYHNLRYMEAANAFQKAYELDPRPFLLYNIALCHEKLGNIKTAVDYYHRYLQVTPSERETIEPHIRILQKIIAPAVLHLRGGIEGSDVWLDGSWVGRLPVGKLLLPTGRPVELRVVKPGFAPFTTTLRAETSDATMELTIVQPPASAVPTLEEPAKTKDGTSQHAPILVVKPVVHSPTLPAGVRSLPLHEHFHKPNNLTLASWTGVTGATLLVLSGMVGYWALSTAKNAQTIPSWNHTQYEHQAHKARALAVSADVLLGTGISCLLFSFYFTF